MPPKRKAQPYISSNPASPRTPVDRKQKRLNPPRLCLQKSNTNIGNGRLTRGRKRVQMVDLVDNEIEIETESSSDELLESPELLTVKKKNLIRPLTIPIQRISIATSVESGSVTGEVKKKTVKLVSPPFSKNKFQQGSNSAAQANMTPSCSQGLKVPPAPMLRKEPSRRRRCIDELDTINLIDDTLSDDFECFTENVTYRDFELTARESLVEAYQEVQKKKQEIRRATAAMLNRLPSEFLQMNLADILEENGNPESFEKLLKIYDEKYKAREKACGIREVRVNLTRLDEQPNSSASPELFVTPKKQVVKYLPPKPPKTLKGVLKNKTQLIFPSVSNMSAESVESEIRSNNNVFQFGATPKSTVKVPRTVKPGEIVFSQSGSPIVTGTEVTAPETPVQSCTGKAVRIQIENGEGKALEVEIIYRGNPQEDKDAKAFRSFMADVRGVVATRSTVKNKRTQPPIVPAKKPPKNTAPKVLGSAPTTKKPQWVV